MTGDKLKRRRKGLELSQANLALKLGTTTNTIARWEREEMKIQNPVLLDLALKFLEYEAKSKQKRT